MNLVPTELNQRLANALRYSVDADRFYIGGKAGFWRLIGLGLIGFGLGAAIGIGFYGYSHITRNSHNLTSFSSTFSKALSDARLRATAQGTVQVESRELSLAPGQTISLDHSSRLLLDPSAKVLAEGEITIQGPSISVPQTAPPRSASSVPAIVNFTVFKAVAFERGTVQTGWVFLTSAQRSPTHQYCYYTEFLDTPGLNVMFDIGDDQKMETPKTLPKDFDLVTAFNKCVWFKS